MSAIQNSKHTVTNVCSDSLCCALLATVLIAPFKQSMRNYFIILSFGILSVCTIGEVVTQELNYRGFHTGLSANLRAPIKECRSVDIRNECQNFADLNGCTVIKGSLKVVLLPKGVDPLPCNYSNYRFPLLREVTEYVIFYDVHGLTTIRDMFPSLTVIRGRRLFLNYALGISNMPDLEALEFRSLIAIQRGHVYIGSSKKLCQLERINFDRLTLTPGVNHIFPYKNLKCGVKVLCRGCKSGYCWSNRVCQKFENDRVINLMQDPQCDTECLGGCFNSTNTGCGVCKGISYHGACVTKCPEDTFYSELPRSVNHAISHVIVHPDYKQGHYHHDIALLVLKTPLNYSVATQPICLQKTRANLVVGKRAMIAGWGKLSSSSQRQPEMSYLDVPLTSWELCLKNYASTGALESPNSIEGQWMCAGGEGKDVCQGFGGAPLFIHENGVYSQIGIMSFGSDNCGGLRIPSVYTSVSHFAEWIHDNTPAE